jgi:hypothetical protein
MNVALCGERGSHDPQSAWGFDWRELIFGECSGYRMSRVPYSSE